MPPERLPPDKPAEWLNRAMSDLALAGANDVPGVYLEDLCFHAQQAVEKSLKSLLLYRKIPFRYVHDLAELISLLEKDGLALPAEVCESARLTEFAVASRYPGVSEPVTIDEYKEAVSLAACVVEWVRKTIRARNR